MLLAGEHRLPAIRVAKQITNNLAVPAVFRKQNMQSHANYRKSIVFSSPGSSSHTINGF
jgi:hypothetical protein